MSLKSAISVPRIEPLLVKDIETDAHRQRPSQSISSISTHLLLGKRNATLRPPVAPSRHLLRTYRSSVYYPGIGGIQGFRGFLRRKHLYNKLIYNMLQ